jgi:hypothetical protein
MRSWELSGERQGTSERREMNPKVMVSTRLGYLLEIYIQ